MRAGLEAGAAATGTLTLLALLILAPTAGAESIGYVKASFWAANETTSIAIREAAVFPLRQFWFNVTIPESYEGWLVIPVPAKLAKEFTGSGVWIPGHKAVVMYDPVDELADLWVYGNWSRGQAVVKGYLGPGGRAYNYTEAMTSKVVTGSVESRSLVALPLYLYVNPDIVVEEHETEKPNWLLNIPGSGEWHLAAWIPSASNGLIISKEGANNTGWGLYFDGIKYYLEAAGKRYPVCSYTLSITKLGAQVPVTVYNLKVFYMRDYTNNGPVGDWQQIDPPPTPNTEPVRIHYYGVLAAFWITYGGGFDWQHTLLLLVPRIGAMSPALGSIAARMLGGKVEYVKDVNPNLWGKLGGPIVPGFLREDLEGYTAILADSHSLVWLLDSRGYRRGGATGDNAIAIINIEGFNPEKIVWIPVPSFAANTTVNIALLNGYGMETVYWPWALIAAAGAGLAALYLLRRR